MGFREDVSRKTEELKSMGFYYVLFPQKRLHRCLKRFTQFMFVHSTLTALIFWEEYFNYFLSTSDPHIKILKKKTNRIIFFSEHTCNIHAQQINCGPKLREIGGNFIKTQLRATRWCFNLIFFFLTFLSKLKSYLRQ